jgi:hypothetical protein
LKQGNAGKIMMMDFRVDAIQYPEPGDPKLFILRTNKNPHGS